MVPFDLNMLGALVMGDVILLSQGIAPSQLAKLLPVVDYDDVPIKHVPWEPKWRLHLVLVIIEITVSSVVWAGSFYMHLSM